ncbi:MAG: hypothetical protein ABWY64_09250 [Tardiphaga sp.]
MSKEPKTKMELEEIGLRRIREWPGCTGVVSVTITREDHRTWKLGAYDPGTAQTESVRRAAARVTEELRAEFILTE